MEIIVKDKKNHGDTGELVPFNASEADVKDEVNKRTSKAGYTTKYGECPYATKIMSMPPSDRFRENYVKVFGHE